MPLALARRAPHAGRGGDLVLGLVAGEDLADLEQRHIGKAAIGVLLRRRHQAGDEARPHVREIGRDRIGERELRPPPPNNWACALAMNDHVTASVRPRAASARLALRVRTWAVVSTGLRGASPRSSGADGTRSTPMIRTTSSTISAVPSMSGRHDGTATFTRSPWPATKKPRCPSTRRTSVRGTSRPVRRLISLRGKSMTRSSACGLPETVTSDGVPPTRSSTIWVASSRPGTMKAGSTPRSKR